MYQQLNGISWDNDETGVGDSSYSGATNRNIGCSSFLRKFSHQHINSPLNTLQDKVNKENFNEAIDIFRAPVECCFGGAKQPRQNGDGSLGRFSLHLSRPKASMFVELAQMMHDVKMKMRGQVHQSNLAVLNHPFSGIKESDKVFNELLAHLVTAEGRKNAFFGSGLSGLGVVEHDPLPI